MRVIVLSSFIAYTAALAVLQQIVGAVYKANDAAVRKVQYPRFNMFISAALACFIVAVLTMQNDLLDNLVAIRLFGLFVILLGLILTLCAQRQLGKFWVGGIGLHRQHKLITTGVYKYIRHPLYAGMLLSGVGLVLTSLNVWYGLGSMIYVGAYAVRIPFEEVELSKRFKKKYERYFAQTGAVLPKIGRRS